MVLPCCSPDLSGLLETAHVSVSESWSAPFFPLGEGDSLLLSSREAHDCPRSTVEWEV